MKLISTSKELQSEFLRLQNSYNNYYWMTAWAGIKSDPYKTLIAKEHKIKKIVVGIHFYQTHPDFIEKFIDNHNIKYIKQPSGTFHPKLFLFYNAINDWELLVGSANFTDAAFKLNTEATCLISCRDNNSAKTLKDIFKLIDKTWETAKLFDTAELAAYRLSWEIFRPRINSLSGRFGKTSDKPSGELIPVHLFEVETMTWDSFMKKVYSDVHHSLQSRINVIQVSKALFSREGSFSSLTEDERKFIAGIPNNLEVADDTDWGYFGSMQGAGIYRNRIKNNDKNISAALDEIPSSGQITRSHYIKFIAHYQKAFKNTHLENANNLGSASRLLAMKRPDIFVCFDNRNKSALCKAFGIVQSGLNYERYWDDIIERIYISEWWTNPAPKNKKEKLISNARSAFLDSLYYEQ